MRLPGKTSCAWPFATRPNSLRPLNFQTPSSSRPGKPPAHFPCSPPGPISPAWPRATRPTPCCGKCFLWRTNWIDQPGVYRRSRGRRQRPQLSAGLLQKYDGRALLITTGACAVHCRYCFRRHYPYSESPRSPDDWQPAIDRIAADPTIDEVILSGGDPLTLVDGHLAELAERHGPRSPRPPPADPHPAADHHSPAGDHPSCSTGSAARG